MLTAKRSQLIKLNCAFFKMVLLTCVERVHLNGTIFQKYTWKFIFKVFSKHVA